MLQDTGDRWGRLRSNGARIRFPYGMKACGLQVELGMPRCTLGRAHLWWFTMTKMRLEMHSYYYCYYNNNSVSAPIDNDAALPIPGISWQLYGLMPRQIACWQIRPVAKLNAQVITEIMNICWHCISLFCPQQFHFSSYVRKTFINLNELMKCQTNETVLMTST
jgi:hypothetical protein